MVEHMTIYYSYLASPIGDLLLAGDGDNLHLLGFPEGKMRTRHQDLWRPDDAVFSEVKSQLKQLVDQRLTGKIGQEEYDRRRRELLDRL